MKLTIGNQLLDALNLASRIIPRTTIKPILRCVKLEASGDSLIVSATDLETRMRYRVDCNVDEPGRVVIPLDKLKAAIEGMLPKKKQKKTEHVGFFKQVEETVAIEADDNDCYVRKGANEFKILGYDSAEYPATIDFAESVDFQVSPKTLSWMIPRVLFAAAKEHSHYAISGVLWEIDGDDLAMVATDGHRLAEVTGKLASSVDEPIKMILCTEVMGLLRTLCGKEHVDFSVDGNHTVYIRRGDIVLASALKQGNFPSYKDVIPGDVKHEATVETERIAHCIRDVCAMTDGASRGIKMSFREGEVGLSGCSVDTGEAKNACAAEYSGDGISIGFNPVFLLDFLATVGSKRVMFGMNGPNKPVIIRSDKGFTYVIMPVDIV